MITLCKLEWSNFRSYGGCNNLMLNSRTLTQLLGDNGAGKTTIPLMLQEVLYGKNIKGIKKEGLSNRYTDTPGYEIVLTFTKDEDVYKIVLQRAKVKLNLHLYCNGEDISSHTATATYKTIAEIIGIPDFKTFCQLTYQSTTDALDFLTATDTQRKRFLIGLLDLSIYLEYHESAKTKLKSITKDINILTGKISSAESWIAKHENRVTEPLEEKRPVSMPEGLLDQLFKLKADIDNITKINTAISTNNKYKEDLVELGNVSGLSSPDLVTFEATKTDIEGEVAIYRDSIAKIDKELRSLAGVNTIPTCSKCGQSIEVEDVTELVFALERNRDSLEVGLTADLKDLATVKAVIKQGKADKKTIASYETLVRMIDDGVPNEALDLTTLRAEAMELSAQRVNIQAEMDEIVKYNLEVVTHNSEISTIAKQLEEFHMDLLLLNKKLDTLTEMTTYLSILKDAFSTNGLVSYKVESSIKHLEVEINNYLAEFSEFRLRFKLAGEKLNVEILDDLRNILDIQTVSTGELGRINIATGLAIRKLLSTLTSTRLNFLFLDEIVGVLDPVGKETLFDILQKEDLNTIMVAHEETHPLIPKMEITKQGKISSLREDQNGV